MTMSVAISPLTILKELQLLSSGVFCRTALASGNEM